GWTCPGMMRVTGSGVRWRPCGPAPYVTETNEGLSACRLAIVWNSSADASSVLGGKNSKLIVVGCWRRMSWMCMGGPNAAPQRSRYRDQPGSGRGERNQTIHLLSLTHPAIIKQSYTSMIDGRTGG